MMMNANKHLLVILLAMLMLASTSAEFGNVNFELDEFIDHLPEDESFWGRELLGESMSVAPTPKPPSPRPPSGTPPTPKPPTSGPAPTNPPPTPKPPTNPAPTPLPPSDPAPTNPAPTNPAPTNPAPTNPDVEPTEAPPTEGPPTAPPPSAASPPTPRPPTGDPPTGDGDLCSESIQAIVNCVAEQCPEETVAGECVVKEDADTCDDVELICQAVSACCDNDCASQIEAVIDNCVPGDLCEDISCSAGEQPTENIAEVLAGDDRFTTLVSAVTAAGLLPALEGQDRLTVFAPTNQAFVNLGLPSDTDQATLQAVLLYHAVGEFIDPLVDGESYTTLNGADVTITVTATETLVNDSNVIDTLLASNGIIYVIDAVLIPPSGDGGRTLASNGGRYLRSN